MDARTPAISYERPPVSRAGPAHWFDRLDHLIASTLRRYGLAALRVALGVIFVWFGVLKPFGVSPAQELVEDTVYWMPFLSPRGWVTVIGWWEVAIGVAFLIPRPWATRAAIGLMALQMGGTFLPLVLLPNTTFQPGRYPWAPTTEGQYIIKNLLILAAAMVLGGTVRPDTPPPVAAAHDPAGDGQG